MPGPNPIRSNIQEQIYEILKEDIVNGKLEPGKQMKELELVDRFQVSRSPIREALRRLCGDGLLVIKPNCGIYVNAFTSKYINDLLEMRSLLESHGMEQLIGIQLSEETRQELLSLRERMQDALDHGASLQEHMDLDLLLHQLIVSFNHNEFMAEVAQKISLISKTMQRISLSSGNRAEESQLEHLEIIDHLLAGQVQKAIKCNPVHLFHTQVRVEEEMSRSLSK